MRRRVVAALVVALVCGACTTNSSNHPGDRSENATSTMAPSVPTTMSTLPVSTRELTGSVTVVAAGTDARVCALALAAAGPQQFQGAATVIAHAAVGSVRWLICMPGPAIGPGVVSARTADGGHWAVTVLCASTPFHAGDAIDAHIEDAKRAWITMDIPVAPGHTHAWTENGGETWTCASA